MFDDDKQNNLEYGQRIRACQKQPELSLVSEAAQITVLLAMTEKLLDHVILDRMTHAIKAVREAAMDIPVEVRERFDTAERLSDEDRAMIIQIASNALAPFLTNPEPVQAVGTN